MTDKTLGVDKRWTYCPECGSTEIRHAEGDHKQCACCLQEWFADIDYTDVVRTNLGNRMQLRSSLTARDEALASIRVLAAGVPYPPLGTDPRRAPEPAAGQPPKLYRLIPKFDPFMYQEFPTALWDLILIPQSPETKDGGA